MGSPLVLASTVKPTLPCGVNSSLSNIAQIRFRPLRTLESMAPDPAFPTEKENEQANLSRLVAAIEEERQDNGKPRQEQESSDTKIA
jgi:hypothetical protein